VAAALVAKTADPELNFFFEFNHQYRSSSTTTTAAAAAAQHQQKSGSLSNLPLLYLDNYMALETLA
jgi:hypothetical protein